MFGVGFHPQQRVSGEVARHGERRERWPAQAWGAHREDDLAEKAGADIRRAGCRISRVDALLSAFDDSRYVVLDACVPVAH
ncbi:MAG: hypothetical protein ABIZ18_08840 [Caldimonas sp.]